MVSEVCLLSVTPMILISTCESNANETLMMVVDGRFLVYRYDFDNGMIRHLFKTKHLSH